LVCLRCLVWVCTAPEVGVVGTACCMQHLPLALITAAAELLRSITSQAQS
jgi:hypothetical protein